MGCPRGVMLKSDGLRNRNKRVRTPVALLRSLSGKYPWGRYGPPYPPSYKLNSTTAVLLGEWLGIKLPPNVDMPLNKETEETEID